VWLAIGNGNPRGSAVEHVLPDLEALGRFSDELRCRAGIDDTDGIGGLVRLHGRLKRSLDAIPTDELERMRADTQALIARFEEIACSMHRLEQLKRLVGD
jgi:hypothetical protein